MPEYHQGTDIEILPHVATSAFRNAIPNTKRYTKLNEKSIVDVANAAYEGDYDVLEELLSTGDEINLFNGDLNQHVNQETDTTIENGPFPKIVVAKGGAFESPASAEGVKMYTFSGPVNGPAPQLKTSAPLPSAVPAKKISKFDLNQTVSGLTALQMASMSGQTECVELLLKAKADPHMRACVSYGTDPEDGKTALDLAQEYGWSDTADLLAQAEKDTPYGFYVPEGPTNNMKSYGNFQWETKPAKGWYMSRPGAARRNGLDPSKYGDVELEEEEEEIDMPTMTVQLPSEPPLPLGLLFPGQGSQYKGMLESTKNIPKVKEYIEKVSAALEIDILDLCLNGPESKLEQTKYCQPAMFLAGMAGVEKLRAEREEAVTRPQVIAGLSLGEYVALCVAEVFTFDDCLALVKLRGAAMDEAAVIGKQAMLSVAGIDKAKLQELCAEAKKKEGPDAICQIANELFPKGFSCGGTQQAIETLKEMTEKAGALQAKLLKTAGGFHTPLMKPAQEKLGKALDSMLPKMKPPKFQVFMNATAQPVKPGTHPRVIVDLLKKQLTSPVLWEPSVRAMIKDGVTDFYEVGPMKQIKAMMKRIDSKAWGTTINIEV